MTQAAPAEQMVENSQDMRWMSYGWLVIGPLVFAVTAATAYRPSFATLEETALAIVPFVVLVATIVALLGPLGRVGLVTQQGATVVAVAGWAILMLENDNWSFLTFVLFALCFSAGPWFGMALAGAVSMIWATAWAVSGQPTWMLPIPVAVFVVGALLALTITRTELTKQRQADLIVQLTRTRQELADAERTKGILEERARFASEIHDTLAQGFTSIVLVSRAALRNGDTERALISNESTALENLAAARRLVAAIQPAELDTASLPDALDRQVNSSLPTGIESEFRVVGEPRALNGAVEVTLLRAAQEALLNIKNHAHAQHVDVTLSYLDDVVALDVRDDGVGFKAGAVHDRGRLTGGQGLEALQKRAQSLSGELRIEALESGGSVVSMLLPAGS